MARRRRAFDSWEDVQSLSLEEWLGYLNLPERRRPRYFPHYQFPSDSHFTAYVSTIGQRTDREIKMLLRNFLIAGGGLGVDGDRFSYYTGRSDILDLVEDHEYVRRLMNLKADTWEGLTWVLDLLPNHPAAAIAAIEAYDQAHFFILPDGRVAGLHDACAVIRAKYLDAVSPETLVDSLTSREFEFLVAALFLEDGFNVTVTKVSRDGGYDLLAEKDRHLSAERVLVECKCQRARVGVQVARALTGVVDAANATRGVLVTTATFTRPTVQYARDSGRVELIDHAELCRRLNAHFGPHWVRRASEIARSVRTRMEARSNKATERVGFAGRSTPRR